MEPGRYKNWQVPMTEEIEAWVEGRCTRAACAIPTRQVLSELYFLQTHLTLELGRIPLSVPEALCIADVQQNAILTLPVASQVALGLETSFGLAPGLLGKKWGIDESAILAKVRAAGPTADHALADATSAWWAAHGSRDRSGLRAVGLNIVDDETSWKA